MHRPEKRTATSQHLHFTRSRHRRRSPLRGSLGFLFELTAIADGDFRHRLATLRSERLDLPDDLHARKHLAKDDVLLVEPARDDRRDEEL